jgi:hypothetical protein
MSNSSVRFQICLWAALLATVLQITGVNVAAMSAQGKLIGAGNGAALR